MTALVDFVEADIQSLKRVYSSLSVSASFDDFLNNAVIEIERFHQLVELKKIDPLELHNYRLKRTCEALNALWEEIYVNLYQEELYQNSKPFDGVYELLSTLKGNVKLGLLSNAYDTKEQLQRIRSSGLFEFFDEILVAGGIGIYKPDPEVFRILLNKLNAKPKSSIYIGDSITHDVRGAKAAGMDSVFFSKKPKKPCSDATYSVVGIKELSTLLKGIVVQSNTLNTVEIDSRRGF